MKVKTVDVDKFADEFEIERNIAYGFLRFVSEAGLVKTGKRPQPAGRKGKPATLFHLDAGLGERLVKYLENGLADIQTVELVEVVAVPVATTQVASPVEEQVASTVIPIICQSQDVEQEKI